jgi:hypothetical protein
VALVGIPLLKHSRETQSGRRAWCWERTRRAYRSVCGKFCDYIPLLCVPLAPAPSPAAAGGARDKSLSFFFQPPPVILQPLSGGWIAKLVHCIVLKGFALDAGLSERERESGRATNYLHTVCDGTAWVLPLSLSCSLSLSLSATRMAWHPQHNPSRRKSKGIDSATNHTLSQPGADLQFLDTMPLSPFVWDCPRPGVQFPRRFHAFREQSAARVHNIKWYYGRACVIQQSLVESMCGLFPVYYFMDYY